LSGGTLDVLSGGIADPTTILSGGNEIISGHGPMMALRSPRQAARLWPCERSDDLHWLANCRSGRTASNTTVSSSGTETVLSGGTAIGATIVTGGKVTVSSGGTFELTSGAVGAPVVRPGATLEIGSGYVFSGTVNSGIKVEVLSDGADIGAT